MIELPDMADFAGSWHIQRTIEDRLSDKSFSHNGTASLVAGGFEGGMIYREVGELGFGDSEGALEATHLFLWKPHPRGIEIFLQDGKLFHLMQMDRLMPDSEHFNTPDMYYIIYDFSQWPSWGVQWRVRGPAKDFRMNTTYSR